MAGFEAVIPGAFVSAAINGVVETAHAYFAARYKENKSMKGMLDKLNDSLPRIQAVLEFADQKPFERNKYLAEWLQQLKDVIYEAEDVMDDFEAIRIKDSLKNKIKVSEIASSCTRAVKSALPLTNDEIKLKALVEKIEIICNTIPDLITLVKESGNYSANDRSSSPPTEETSSFLPKYKKFFGRDMEIKSILNMILPNQRPDAPPNHIPAKRKKMAESSDHSEQTLRSTINKIAHSTTSGFSVGKPRIKVLPIVGIGGIGKTAIAQVIYNHERVREYFDIQGWVYVTSNPHPKKLVFDILCAFDVETCNSTPIIYSLDQGHYRLSQAIKHKRLLLVLDDLREGTDWISSIWKELIDVLAYGACESTIIVTTRDKSIATMIGTLPTLTLHYLPEQQFLSLFEYYAFDYDMKISNSETTYTNKNQHFTLAKHEETVLRSIGEKIAAKLYGLPLAAVVIGFSLSKTKCREYWENILESDWWEYKNIVYSLGVSFHNVDHDLKQCFMYCSLFPRNHVFDKDRLVQMWIAHGFIHPTKGEKAKLENKEIEIEDIGRSKFDKLVDRFFFESTEFKNQYVMHDLIREFAAAISSDMCYVHGHLKDKTTIPSSVRHLACDPNTDPDNSLEHVKWGDKQRIYLRTIMFLRYSHLITYECCQVTLDKLVGLRLLDLSFFSTNERINSEFPYRKHQLLHLRLLDLSFSGIVEISTSLCDLVHLQVLDLRGCYILVLPNGMNKLINLRHLYANSHTLYLVHGIGRLTNLQELEAFRVRKEKGFTVSELAGLKSLHGQLTIKNFEEVSSKEEASLARLEEKKNLTSLIYDVGETATSRDHQVEVLEGLKPHKYIRNLGITKFMSVSLPSWIMERNNLRGIELLECYYVETLPPFGSLPSLEVIKLSGLESITSIGEEFYGTSDVTFPFLRELTIDKMDKWTTWSNPSNDPSKRQFFPCLQKLQIKGCMNLSGAPILYLNSSLVELCLECCDIVVKNVGGYFPALTSLTRLNMSALQSMKIDLHSDIYLSKLQVLSLKNINIGKHEGQTSCLVNLNKLVLDSYLLWGAHYEQGLLALKSQKTDNLPSLGCIEVRNSYKIPEVLFRLGMFSSLRTLWIDKYENDTFMLDEDSWLQQLSSLEDLRFSRCLQLGCLPPSLSTLPSLKKFTVENCPDIKSLPPNGLPRSLEELYIIGCSSELMQGCQPNIGAEWSKISHVPCIRVVDKLTNLRPPAV